MKGKVLYLISFLLLLFVLSSGDTGNVSSVINSRATDSDELKTEENSLSDSDLDNLIGDTIIKSVDSDAIVEIETPKDISEMNDDELSTVLIDKITESINNSNNSDASSGFGIKFYTANYIDVVDGSRILVEMGGEEKIVKLIGLTNGDKSILNKILSNFDEVYLEFDLVKYEQNEALAYVWIEKPSLKNKDKMVNSMMLEGGYADYKQSGSNIKYNHYFLGIK